MPPGSGVVSAAKILRPDTPEPLVPSIIARNDRHMTQPDLNNPVVLRAQALGVTPRLEGESTKDYLKRVDLYYHYLLSGRLPA